MNLVGDLHRHRAKRYSQNGEDGVLARLLEVVGATNRVYVELGAGSGQECNTRLLHENGWSGVMIDRDHEDSSLSLHREFITAENVNDLLAKYEVPDSFDLLSIDIDGNDHWVWKAITPRYRPRVVVIEYNGGVPIDIAVAMPYEPDFRWTGQSNTGQSLLALQKLSAAKGYSLVYAAAPNAFLVLRSLLSPKYREVSAKKAAREHWMSQAWHRRRWKRELQQLDWMYV